MGTSFKRLLATIGFSALIATVLVTAVSASEGERVAAPPSCERLAGPESVDANELTDEGHYSGQQWLVDQAESVDAVHEVVASFSEVVVGVGVDHSARAVVVYTDPGATTAELESKVVSAAGALSVVVKEACRPSAELDDTREQLVSAASSLRSSGGAASFSTRPDLGLVQVLTDDAQFAKSVSAEFSRDLVNVVVVEEMGRLVGGRTNDGIPHYGDARITGPSGSCSSNFSFSHPVFYRVTATAGHCGSGTWTSGSNTVGATLGAVAFPDPDMQMLWSLWSLWHDYTNKIYTDPCCPSTRNVIGKSTPGVGGYVCVGGATTLAQCGIEVISTDSDFCDAAGCTTNLTQVFRLGLTPFASPGDSGGVVYQRSGSSNALASGLIVARDGPVFGGYTDWHHTTTQVENQFGITLVTSP